MTVTIRGGTVVDGTGAPPRRADVVIEGARVAGIGAGAGGAEADTVIDATGMLVTPGFVDLHTHYDAQLFWDPNASPSPLHGVTTVLGGNCGFSLAPMAPEHVDYISRMMARVEGMPLAALRAGVPWDWSSFGDWLERLDGRIAVNAGFLVGHSTLRRLVMGERAVGGAATAHDIDAMEAALHAALAPELEAARVDLLFAAGPLSRALFDATASARRAFWAERSDGLRDPLIAVLRAGDVVMVKGSNGSRMGPLIAALREHFPRQQARG